MADRCRACVDTGLVTEIDDAAPYAPTPAYRRSYRYCNCDAGQSLKAREAKEQEDFMEDQRRARDWADSNMSPPEADR